MKNLELLNVNTENYQDIVNSINDTCDYFFPNDSKPKVSKLSLDFCTVIMYVAVDASRKYAVAEVLMKSIPNLTPPNAVAWLKDLPWPMIKALFNEHQDIYKAVYSGIISGFRLAYHDLTDEDNDYDLVYEKLRKYNSLLGTNY